MVTQRKERLSAALWAMRQMWASSARLITGIMLCTVLQGLVPAAFAVSLRGLINAVPEYTSGASSLLDNPFFWLVAAALITVSDTVTNQISLYLSERLRNDFSLYFNRCVMEHASRLDLPFFENHDNREAIERVSQDPGGRLHSLFFKAQKSILSLFQVITLAGLLIWLEPLILLFALLLTIPFFIFNWRLARARYTVMAGRSLKQRRTRYFLRLLTTPSQVGEIKILGIGPLLTNRFVRIMKDFRDQDRKLQLRQLFGGTTFMVPIIIVFYALFGRVVYRVITGELSVGDLAMFGGAVVRLRTAVDQAIRSMAICYEKTLHTNDLRNFLKSGPVVVDRPDAEDRDIDGAISVRDVNFTYPGAADPVLRGVSFEIQPGESIAIVGKNGSGKSTLAKLLARLYDPDSGDIRIDNRAITDYPVKDYHRKIAFLAQNFGRFEDTIANNLAYGDWERLCKDRAEVERIAAQTGLDDIASALPDGLDTPLGRLFSAHDFSGGQWQLLAAARMLARNASIIILDEPTSNIDSVAENHLIQSIETLAGDKTKIIISHRFSTINMADRILVMDGGQLVEQGNHQELLAKDGHYAKLYRMHEHYRMNQNS